MRSPVAPTVCLTFLKFDMHVYIVHEYTWACARVMCRYIIINNMYTV